MCEQVSVELPGEPRSARRARRFVAEQCYRWRLGELCEDLSLPVSELVTNAVLHAHTPATITVSLSHGCVEVSVRDSDPRRPILRPVRLDLNADIDAVAGRLDHLPEDLREAGLHVGAAGSITAGRGLHIVDAVADEWGVSQLAVGKDVWFRVRTPSAWQPHVRCECPTGAVTTPGGKPFRASY